MASSTIAYCYYELTGKEWTNFCPSCYRLFRNVALPYRADAEMLDLNGDVMVCDGCFQEIH